MSKYDFLLQVEESLKTRPEISGASISSRIYTKNNDTEYLGITIYYDPEKLSPVIYVDRYYEAYCRKKLTVDEAVDEIIMAYRSLDEERAEHSDISLSFDDCKDRIIYRLVSLKKNKKYLEDLPHVIWNDLAVIFAVLYKQDDEGTETIKITYDLMDSWDKHPVDLMELARKNTPRLFPAVLHSLADVLGIEDLDLGIMLLSNKAYVYGASSLIDENTLVKIGNLLEDDYYVVPSSIHEVLIVPKSLVRDVSDIEDMIRAINEDHVLSTDVLSDNLYFYDRTEKRFYF